MTDTNAIVTTRPLTVREDGVDGIPNIFRQFLGLPLAMCVEYYFYKPITLQPGESVEIILPLVIDTTDED